jgi:CRISPR-associated protein (TIGR02710 family)
MTQVLIVSLGGSPDPIVNCIDSLRPERVVFLCSEASREQVDAVLSRVHLPTFDAERDVEVLQQRLSASQGEEVINELDQLDRIYSRSLDLIQRVRTEEPGRAITVDYTGGTKSMTAGLAMAAIDDRAVRISLTTHERAKGQQALSGHSSPGSVSVAAIQARRLRDLELPALLARYDYDAARLAVGRIRRLPDQDANTARFLGRLEDLLVVLDAWDRFDHLQAVNLLVRLGERRLDASLLFPLKLVIGSRRLLDKQAEEDRWPSMRGHGLEAVEDLLRNAERRASQSRYDDAVGRLYRAMELTAQILLKIDVKNKTGGAGIDTGDVAIERLPEAIRSAYEQKRDQRAEDGKLKIGLQDSYDLLAALEHPVGLRWSENRSRLVDRLQIRNNSLFAHGFASIQYQQWKSLQEAFGGFLQSAIDDALQRGKGTALAQLPSQLQDLLLLE